MKEPRISAAVDSADGIPPPGTPSEVEAAVDVSLSTRREFLSGAMTASGLVLSGLLETSATETSTSGSVLQGESSLLKVGEIPSVGGRLRGVITINTAKRLMPADQSAGTPGEVQLLRYLEGKNSDGKVVWPPPEGGSLPPPLPGPTLRARVGDRVELTFLNHVQGFGQSLDRVEQGESDEGCHVVKLGDTETKLYPTSAEDKAPNCFHGSSTTNVHFHGTHVTPDGLGDNVLLQLRPNPDVTEGSVQADFARIFEAGPPNRWGDLPRSWRERQLRLLKRHDDTAIWRGTRGTTSKPALPPENRLLPPTEARIRRGLWPQYQVGAYPYCFDLTEYISPKENEPPRFEMAQCPGTHWYHAHKHGSTALNVYHGLAGVFIIEGGYDDALRTLYPSLKDTEKVLIVQNFSAALNLMRLTGSTNRPPSLWVNGRLNPTLTMRPGEIQLWRFVNASVRAVMTLVGFEPVKGVSPEIKQTAQDGVQFSFANFQEQPLLKATAVRAARANRFAPGNRVDLLVKAPLAPGSYRFRVEDTTKTDDESTEINERESVLLTLSVQGEPIHGQAFPTDDKVYPEFPRFLKDISDDEVQIFRKLDFGWEAGRSFPGGGAGAAAPKFMINRKQFRGDRYDQTMVLGDCEEWTLLNSTTQIAHPFHIHVNPFQVIEIFDPSDSAQPYQPKASYVWQDVIAIPPAARKDGELVNGWVRIRHRFADFAGSYVLHCHMLAHEDRGMMQLVRVISGKDDVPHH